MEGGPGDDRLLGGGGGRHGSRRTGQGPDRDGSGSVEALFGGRGDDRLLGRPGSFDGLIGGPGNDLLNGGPGQDLAQFFGRPARSRATSRPTWSRVTGPTSSEASRDSSVPASTTSCSATTPRTCSSARRATTWSRPGVSTLGDLGADVLDGADNDDTLESGDGADIVQFEHSPNAVTVDLAARTATGWGADTLASIDVVIGSDFGDASSATRMPTRSWEVPATRDRRPWRGGSGRVLRFDFEPVVVDPATGTATAWGADTLVGLEDVLGSAPLTSWPATTARTRPGRRQQRRRHPPRRGGRRCPHG